MPTQVQFRRGTTAQNQNFTGAAGEISIDTDKKTVVVHDGTTTGGRPLAPNSAFDVANSGYGIANVAYNTTNTAFGVANSGYGIANAAYSATNSVFGVANAAFNSANNVAPQVAPAFNTANAAFNKANNALANTSNVVFAGDLRVTGNVFVGTSTVTITNNSVTATSITATNLVVNGSAVPSGATANLAFDTANAAFGVANNAYTATNGAAAFAFANGVSTNTTAAFGLTNTTYAAVNSAFAVINTAYTSQNAGYTTTNAAFGVANAAYGYANASNTWVNSTFLKLTAGQQTITGNVSITGNLTILGGSTLISSNNLSVGDSLIYLAANNYSGTDLLDIGFVANYGNTTAANVHTGLVRDATDKQYYLFNGYDAEPANNTFVPGSNNMVNAVLVADFNTSNLTLGGANAITWIKTAFDTANAAYTSQNSDYTTTNAAFGVANAAYGQVNTLATSANSYASAVGTSTNNYTSATYSTLTQFGSVFGVANGAFGAANGKVASVTGTAGQIYSSGGTAPTLNLISSGVTAATYGGGGTQVPVLTVDAYGRVTSASNTTVNGMDYAYANTIWGVANAGFTVANAAFAKANAAATAASPTFTGTVNVNANTAFQTLTDGATISWDVSTGQIATVTLGGNRTVAAPTNLKIGTYILHVIQDATGSRTLTWNAVFKWPAATAPTLTTTANARDIFSFICDGTNLYGTYVPDVR
jgi:hypothetical protein